MIHLGSYVSCYILLSNLRTYEAWNKWYSEVRRRGETSLKNFGLKVYEWFDILCRFDAFKNQNLVFSLSKILLLSLSPFLLEVSSTTQEVYERLGVRGLVSDSMPEPKLFTNVASSAGSVWYKQYGQ